MTFKGRSLNLHVGHGKTGSSYLQTLLAVNRDVLFEFGVNYPDHQSLQLARSGLPTSGNGNLLFQRDFEPLGNTLLSNEGFCYRLSVENNYRKFVQRHNCFVSVHLFSRNLFEFLNSSWLQSIKTGLTSADFDAFVRSSNFKIYESVLWWLKNENVNKLHFRNYSKHRSDIGNIFLNDLLGRGFQGTIRTTSMENINRSLTNGEAQVVGALNKLNFHSGKCLAKALITLDPVENFQMPYLSRDTYDFVVGKVEETIGYMLVPDSETVVIESFESLRDARAQEFQNKFVFTKEQLELILLHFSSHGRMKTLERASELAFKALRRFLFWRNSGFY